MSVRGERASCVCTSNIPIYHIYIRFIISNIITLYNVVVAIFVSVPNSNKGQ